MEAKIITHFTDKNAQNLITKEKVLIEWSSEIGFGQLIFKDKGNGIYEVDTEAMSFQHIVNVLKALK